MIDPSMAVTAAPARASLTGVAPSRPSEPRAYTRTEATAAPAKANHTYPSSDVRPKPVDADDDEQGGAGVDAEDAGVGERVAGEALHDRAADAERGAGEQADDGARDPQRAHDQVVVVRRVEVEQGVEHGAERDRLGADGDARQADEDEHADGERRGRRRGRSGGSPTPPAPPRPVVSRTSSGHRPGRGSGPRP